MVKIFLDFNGTRKLISVFKTAGHKSYDRSIHLSYLTAILVLSPHLPSGLFPSGSRYQTPACASLLRYDHLVNLQPGIKAGIHDLHSRRAWSDTCHATKYPN